MWSGHTYIPSTKGFFIKIDRDDYEEISKWKWSDCRGYAVSFSRWPEPRVRMHRLLMGAKEGQIVDHINGDIRDNRKCNLRFVNQNQSAWNSTAKGVVYCKWTKNKPWRVKICKNRKHIHIGYFATENEAEEAYRAATIKYFGQYSRYWQQEVPQ